jgi:CRP/FNR family cyclic AMP-dependent transcriptional regulator
MSQLAAGPAARAAMSRRDPHEMGREWAPVLADVPLFRDLSKRHLMRIAKLGRNRRYASETTIVKAGDAGTAFFVLLDGTARVVPTSGRARRLGAGDFFGEMALLDDAPRSATVVAESDVLTLTIPRSSFGKLLRGEPALAHALLRTLAARLRAVEKTV